MTVAIVVLGVALVAVAGLAGALLRVVQRQLASAEERVQQLIKDRPAPAKPIVVPAPDLTPYLERLATMATEMVGAVLNGSPQPERMVATPEQVVEAFRSMNQDGTGLDEEGNTTETWIPPWEQDDWVGDATAMETIDASLNGS